MKKILASYLLLSTVFASFSTASMEKCIEAVKMNPADMVPVLRALQDAGPEEISVVADALLEAGDPYRYGEYLQNQIVLKTETNRERIDEITLEDSEILSGYEKFWLPPELQQPYLKRIYSDERTGVITGLDVYPSEVRGALVHELTSVLENSQLRKLYFHEGSAEFIDTVVDFSKLSNLKDVRVDADENSSLSKILDLVSESENLEKVSIGDFENPELEGRLSTRSLQRLGAMPSLKELGIFGIAIGQPRLMALITELKKKNQIEHLHFYFADIDDNMLYSIAWLTSLKTLDLHSNQVSDEGVAPLLLLAELKSLALTRNFIGDQGVRILSGLKNVEELRLDRNDIQSSEALAMLLQIPTLKELYLRSNNFEYEAMRSFIEEARARGITVHFP